VIPTTKLPTTVIKGVFCAMLILLLIG